jgi:hypothetical protein
MLAESHSFEMMLADSHSFKKQPHPFRFRMADSALLQDIPFSFSKRSTIYRK